MKKAILPVVGLLPFLAGGLLNRVMLSVSFSRNLPLFLIGLAVLVLWGLASAALRGVTGSAWQTVTLLHIPAAVVLVLLGIQELVLGAYWMNPVGVWTQCFYLPLMNLGFSLTFWSHTLFPAYCAAFLLMVAVSILGCRPPKKAS